MAGHAAASGIRFSPCAPPLRSPRSKPACRWSGTIRSPANFPPKTANAWAAAAPFSARRRKPAPPGDGAFPTGRMERTRPHPARGATSPAPFPDFPPPRSDGNTRRFLAAAPGRPAPAPAPLRPRPLLRPCPRPCPRPRPRQRPARSACFLTVPRRTESRSHLRAARTRLRRAIFGAHSAKKQPPRQAGAVLRYPGSARRLSDCATYACAPRLRASCPRSCSSRPRGGPQGRSCP